jgi:Sec7-like guanine-nucleotide exchange factor
MLNTDAHNPNVKKKMELKDFIRNNRGINNQQDLPEEYLSKLYLNIVNNEIKMNELDDDIQKLHDLANQMVGKFEVILLKLNDVEFGNTKQTIDTSI